MRIVLPAVVSLSLAALACSGSSGRSGFGEDETAPPADPAKDTTPAPGFDPAPPPPAQPVEIDEVFGHSSDTLYRLDPVTKSVQVVDKFNGCDQIIDIALDESSQIYGATYKALYRIDKTNAKCTLVANGEYPNSLSFVPKGTLDANAEALVGYDGDKYVRIDTSTGVKTQVGAIGGGLVSSGDIVSVKGGKTYLTVKGGTKCNQTDCLVEVDPKTGAMLKNLGSIGYDNVYGLSFWAGKIYGFNDAGDLFEVTLGSVGIASTLIAIPQKPAGLRFWGAGSTTSAPLEPKPK